MRGAALGEVERLLVLFLLAVLNCKVREPQLMRLPATALAAAGGLCAFTSPVHDGVMYAMNR